MTLFGKGIFLFLLMAICLPACKTLMTKDAPPADQAPEAAELLAMMNERGMKLASLSAKSKIEFYDEKHHERATLFWIAEKPSKLLLEITAPTGLVAIFTANKTEYRYFDAREKKGYHGPVTPQAIKKVMPVEIMPVQLVPILLGTPIVLNADKMDFQWDEKRKGWRLTLMNTNSGWVQFFWFAETTNVLKGVRVISAEKRIVYDVTYLGWATEKKSGIAYPKYLKILVPNKAMKITLKMKGKPKINRNEPPETFQLPFPKNIRPIYLPAE